LTRYPGAAEAEFEDLIDPEIYRAQLLASFNINVDDLKAVRRSKGKWSKRMKLVFGSRGQPWDDAVESRVKSLVANEVVASPDNAVDRRVEGVIEALVAALETKLGAIAP